MCHICTVCAVAVLRAAGMQDTQDVVVAGGLRNDRQSGRNRCCPPPGLCLDLQARALHAASSVTAPCPEVILKPGRMLCCCARVSSLRWWCRVVAFAATLLCCTTTVAGLTWGGRHTGPLSQSFLQHASRQLLLAPSLRMHWHESWSQYAPRSDACHWHRSKQSVCSIEVHQQSALATGPAQSHPALLALWSCALVQTRIWPWHSRATSRLSHLLLLAGRSGTSWGMLPACFTWGPG